MTLATFDYDIPAQPAINQAPANDIVTFWNDVLATKFITYRHIMVGGLSRHSEAVMKTLKVERGASALDVGCGFGDTAVALAGRVGLEGHVLGIDCCDAFLDYARSLKAETGTQNVEFAEGDVEQGVGEALYDFVFARFGTMFFTNPVAGLRAMRRALKPGGQMAHIVWRSRAENPWVDAARDVLLRHLPEPGANAQTCGPGPFSMANEDVTRKQMEAAGYTDISFTRIDAKVLVGTTIEEAIAFQLAIGPAGEVFREAGPLAETLRPEIEADLAKLFEGVERTTEGLWMDSSSWLITARNPRV